VNGDVLPFGRKISRVSPPTIKLTHMAVFTIFLLENTAYFSPSKAKNKTVRKLMKTKVNNYKKPVT